MFFKKCVDSSICFINSFFVAEKAKDTDIIRDSNEKGRKAVSQKGSDYKSE